MSPYLPGLCPRVVSANVKNLAIVALPGFTWRQFPSCRARLVVALPLKGHKREAIPTRSRFNQRGATLADSIPEALQCCSIAGVELISSSG